MFIQCNVVKKLWDDNIESWILERGVIEYETDETTVILGDTQMAYWLNAVLLNTKKVVFINARELPSLEVVKRNGRLMFDYVRLKYIY